MKLTLLLTLFACLQIKASVYSQQINLSVKKASLERVIKEIRKQTGYAFFYDVAYLQEAAPVSMEVNNASIEETLTKVFEGQQFTWEVLDKTILIKPVNKEKGIITKEVQPHVEVKGKVTNEKDEPLSGASVKIKGSSTGTVTDVNGNFSLKSVDPQAVLLISYTGFATREIVVGGRREITVALIENFQSLDELVVIGYGTQTKRDLTGAVSSVKADDLVMSQGPEIGNMLKGKVAGVTIRQTSAQPGGGLDILVRGAGSVNASNDPLFVVDGFPISDLQQPGSGGRYFAGSQSILNSFNPNDIESIEVLKDASATSIYGSRAANGVILITTKKGSEGAPRVNYSNNFTLQKYNDSFDVLPLNEWMQVSNEAAYEQWLFENNVSPWGARTLEEAEANPVNGSYSRLYTQNAIDNVGRGTDWLSLVMRNGNTWQHNLSITGGSNNTKYLVSGNYYDQNGIIKNSGFKRYSVRTNIDQNLNRYLKFGVNLNASRIDNDNTQLGSESGNDNYENSGILRAAIQQGPHILAIDEDGNYPLNPKLSTQPNPYSLLTITDKGRIDRLLLNSYLDIIPVKDLVIKLKAGIDKGVTRRNNYTPKTTVVGATENGRAFKASLDRDDYLLEATATYTKTIAEMHNFNLLAGVSQQKTNSEYLDATATGFVTDAFLWNNMSSATTILPSNSTPPISNVIASYFSRLNYNYGSKYLATVTVRTDGSGVFAENNKWGTFPSAAVGWNVAEESFIKENENLSKTFSQLKLRLSYGQTGNASINSNAFAAYSAYAAWLSADETRLTGVSLSRLANPDLKWETTTEKNLGLDYSLFGGLVEGSIDLYDKIISDLLDEKEINSYHQVNTVIANIGKTQSKGFEISVNTRNIQRKDFHWKTNFAISRYKDTWLERAPDWKPSVYQSDKDPIRARYSRVSDGILQIGEAVPESQPELLPGQIKIKDIDGFVRDEYGNQVVDENGRFLRTGQADGMIDDADTKLMGTTDPSLMVGLTNIITYKKFTLNFDFNGLFGRKMADPNFTAYGISAEGIYQYGYNALRTVKDRWTPTNPSTTQPSSFYGYSPYGVGDFFLQDAWFIRLQNVSLAYSMPSSWFKGAFSSARIQAAAHNIFVISPYTGVDPETDSYTAAYPNIRSFTVGLNLSF